MTATSKIALVIMMGVASLSYGQEDIDVNSFTSKDLYEVIDSSWVLYGNHDKEGMVDYLERFDPQSVRNDTAALDYYYATVIGYGHLEQHDKQFEDVVEGLKIAHKIEDRWMLLSLYRELASIHDIALDEYEEALKYYKIAEQYLDAVAGDSKSGLMMDIGLTCVEAGLLDSAEVYYNRAFEYLPEDNAIMKADVHTFYTPYLVKTGQYDKAEEYLDYSYNFWKENGYRRPIVENAIDYAQIYYHRGDYRKGLLMLEEALEILEEVPSAANSAKVYEWKAKSEKAAGLSDQSLKSFEMLAIMQDSLEKIEMRHQVGKKKLAFVVNQYKSELDTLQSSNVELATMSNRTKRISFLALAVLFTSTGLYFYFLRSRRLKIEKLTAQLNSYQSELEELKQEYSATISELDQNKRELTSTAMFVEKKDEALKSVRMLLSKVQVVDNAKIAEAIRSARKLADNSISVDSSWESFLYFFDKVYPSFLDDVRQRFPQLSSNDLRSMCYIKMGLTDKEVSRLLGINTASFQKSKYRLKKKLNLDGDTQLDEVIHEL